MNELALSSVRFTRASEQDVRSGLLGYVELTIGGRLRVDGIALRRTRAGRLAISFPSRRDRAGIDHPYLRPVDDVTRRQLETTILSALGFTSAEAQP